MDPNSKKDNFVEAFFKSGTTLQYRVASLLKKGGWNVKLEQAYKDEVELKVRQCDIIATSNVDLSEAKIRLVVECKYIKDGEVVFLVDEKQQYCSTGDMRINALCTGSEQIKTNFKREGHHYSNPPALSSVCLQKDLKGGYKIDDDIIYKAITQTIKPIIDRRQRELPDIVFYPLVVIGDAALYTCPIDSLPNISTKEAGVPTACKPTSHICLEMSYSLTPGHKPHVFIIDIVTEDYLESYLNNVIEPSREKMVHFDETKRMAQQMRLQSKPKTSLRTKF